MKITHLFFLLSLLLTAAACRKQPVDVTPTPDPNPNPYTLIAPPNGWTKSDALSQGFPNTAAFYETKTPNRAFAFVYDLKDTTLVLRTAVDVARPTPTNWLSRVGASERVLMLANGGFFDLTNGASYSLAIDNGKMLSANIRALSRTYNGAATTYYPTRGAFGLVKNVPALGWVYNTTGTTNYLYPTVSPNTLTAPPQPVPSATFPAGGAIWTPTVAIGGSPVLLYKGTTNITDEAELISVNNTTGRSRTAIGFTKDNRVVLLVVEKSATSNGTSLAETAQLLKDWGCTDALNLDGGGSTCMLAAGNQATNAPEAGAQRGVTSVVYVVKK